MQVYWDTKSTRRTASRQNFGYIGLSAMHRLKTLPEGRGTLLKNAVSANETSIETLAARISEAA